MADVSNNNNMNEARVALVTASSAGLGAATAKTLASEGFSVVINYLNGKDKAERMVAEIESVHKHMLSLVPSKTPEDAANKTTQAGQDSTSISKAPHALAVQADMGKRQDIQRLISTTIDHFGRLDVVVSNQGWTNMRNFADLDDNMLESDWDTCFNINVKSHLYLFHAARPYLLSTKGAFVSVASLAGVIPSGSSIPYSVTKAAQIHLIKSLAKISGPEIRVNSVSPGILLTEWGQKFPAERLNAATQKSVLKRLADVEVGFLPQVHRRV